MRNCSTNWGQRIASREDLPESNQPWSSREKPWFPVKIFPTKPIQWWGDFPTIFGWASHPYGIPYTPKWRSIAEQYLVLVEQKLGRRLNSLFYFNILDQRRWLMHMRCMGSEPFGVTAVQEFRLLGPMCSCRMPLNTTSTCKKYYIPPCVLIWIVVSKIISLSLSLSINLSIYLSIDLSINLSIYLFCI